MKLRQISKERLCRLPIVLIGSLAVLLLFASCSFSTGGTVHISLESSVERHVRSGPLQPDMDLSVASYELTLYGPEHTTIVLERTLVSSVRETIFDTLPTGVWRLRVQAKNAAGSIIRSLAYNEALGDRLLTFTVQRGEISTVDCTLIPYWEGEGTASLSLDWALVDDELLLSRPNIIVEVTALSAITPLDDVEVYLSDEDYQIRSQLTGDTLTVHLTSAEEESVRERDSHFILRDLPAGLYEISVELQSPLISTRIWKGIRFLDIMQDRTTSLEILLLDPALQTGSVTFPIVEHVAELDVSFSPTPPRVLTVKTEGDFSVSVAGQDEASSMHYTWYVNGESISVENSPSIRFSLSEAGQYTVTSSVTEIDAEQRPLNWGMAQWELSVVNGEVQR